MAAIATKYSVGNQARMIQRSFAPANMAGLHLKGLGLNPPGSISAPTPSSGSGITSSIIDAASQFIQSRWGQQRGTITYNPDGTITQKQAAGYPIQTQAPYITSGQQQFQTTEGFGTGLATGTTMALVMGGVLVAMFLFSGKRR